MKNTPPPRFAEIVLVTPDGNVCGALPPVETATPWWQDGAPVLKAVKDKFGLDIVLLRLLEAELHEPAGGRVTYLAEIAKPVKALPWRGALDDHPLRLPYARPGGPKAELCWALAELARLGIAVTGKPEQVRSWNLSSVWRIPADGQTVWLKSVPPFFAHEGKMIAALSGQKTPRLLASEGGKMLLAEIQGEDLHEPTLEQRLEMVSILVDVQARWSSRTPELLTLGAPDWRAPALEAAAIDVLSRTGAQLSSQDQVTLAAFAGSLPARFAELAACGIPDTLVHGDFHPGNFRGHGSELTLLDWGDSGIGHPLLDQPAFLERAPDGKLAEVQKHWNSQILGAWPGSDPARASQLLAPIAAARQAVIYQKFLDNIEPSERIYHRGDPARWLSRAAGILQKETAGPL
jgi:Phosphotransferase enzyme family